MKQQWLIRLIVTALYALVAGAVGWANRDSLYYLDGWAKFASVSAIPVLIFAGYYLWHRAYPAAGARWQQVLGISYTVIIIFAAVWLAFSTFAISWDIGTPTNNIRKYDFVANKMNSPFIAHFPRSIPADARAVRFYYEPGFMQAPMIFELGYNATPEQIDALYREYSSRATINFIAGKQYGIIEPTNEVAEEQAVSVDFSEDYTLFYLDEQPPTQKKDWHRPESHGVAISKERHRVVYWAWSG